MQFSKGMADRRTRIFERDRYRCVYCGQVLPAGFLTVDHVQPRAKRGDHSHGNLVTACVRCNTGKGGRPAWEYLKTRPVERENFLKYATHVWERHRRAVHEAAP
jgi:5-methylcytosine-specific restriction endonuclease McrA